jgi:hypothetical protein
MGESIQHVTVQRKRWYDDKALKDPLSTPPDDAPRWVISGSYYADDNEAEVEV